MSGYRSNIIDNLRDWEEMRIPWNELLKNSSISNVFLTWEWLFSWGKSFLNGNRIPFIVVVYENDDLVGIAPWCINYVLSGPFKIRRVEFLGTPETGSDYLDVITKKNYEKEVALFLYETMLKNNRKRWDCLFLREVPANSFFFRAFLSHFDNDGKYVEIEKGSFCPGVILPENLDDYLAGQSRNRRQQFKKHYKKLQQENDFQYLTFTNMQDVELLNTFSELYVKRWGVLNEKLISFLNVFIILSKDRSIVRFDLIKIGNKVIAMTLHLIYKDIIYNFLTLIDRNHRRDISIGNIINELSIENAIINKYIKYDFLKGDEEYKFHWANQADRSIIIKYYQKRTSTIACFIYDWFKKLCKIILR